MWIVYSRRVYGRSRGTCERDFVRQVGPANPDRPRGQWRLKELFLVRVLSFLPNLRPAVADRPPLRRLRSFQFGAECLGQHEGTHQVVDLGDGNGPSMSSRSIRLARF